MSITRLCCGRIIPLLVLILAVFFEWLRTYPSAFGIIFATVSPLLEGRLPPLIIGHGKTKGTPEVPKDMKPLSRPDNELFAPLPGGYQMPLSGIGMCCRYSAYDDVLVRRTVLWYLLQGGRHIDTAHVYRNHRAVGLGIQDAIDRGVPREEIFVVTKIFPPYYGYQSALDVVPTFLEELGLDYIDMVLMHAPKMPIARNKCKPGLSHKECRQETWKALSELREKGVMRNIGVSNFMIHQMQEISELSLAPIANNQFQFNAFVPPAQHKIFDYCLENDIAVTAYYPVGGTMEKAKAAKSSTIKHISEKYGKSSYQVLLRWLVQKGAAVIPGTGNPKHMKDNLDVFSWSISSEDMAMMDGLRSTEEAKKFMYIDLTWFN
mmetsp:Transcript_27289/g.45896  ORF Transcript_27289/g.45896 Transcript_27289/m.45896 type:complete len:377 (+) Transcript_27289:1553-2683(+)